MVLINKERQLPKLQVASSRLVFRSIENQLVIDKMAG
jgi:hypothetical protein